MEALLGPKVVELAVEARVLGVLVLVHEGVCLFGTELCTDPKNVLDYFETLA